MNRLERETDIDYEARIHNAELFQAFSSLSDAQTVIELGGDGDEINREIGHAKHHLWTIMNKWSSDESRSAMFPYEGCTYERS